jgi:ankyrin repeat protein
MPQNKAPAPQRCALEAGASLYERIEANLDFSGFSFKQNFQPGHERATPGQSPADWTIFHKACWAGYIGSVKAMLPHAIDLINDLRDPSGTPAMLAAMNERTSILELMLPYVNHDLRDDAGASLAMLSVGCARQLGLLIDHYDPTECDAKGQNLLDHARSHWGDAEHAGVVALIENRILRQATPAPNSPSERKLRI